MKNSTHRYISCQKCGQYPAVYDDKKQGYFCCACNPQPQTQFHNPRHEDEPLSSRPLRIVCHNCGSPAEFDIVEQTYRCTYCKQTTGLEQKTEKTNTWRKLAFENQRSKYFDLQRHSCPACGAKVVFQRNESSETCDFCASKLVRSQFNDDEQLPDIIIPFFITEDEAKQRLLEWAKQHKRKKESKNIINHIDKLQSYYLPYRMINGELNGLVQKDGIERIFHCKAHIRNMAVNTSKQLDNLLLNEIEPFDWSKAQDFEYAYIAGHRAKLTDISENEIHIRALEEAQDEFLPEIQKTFHSRGVDIQFTTDNHLLNKNALLPIYFIKDGDFSAFMNGQTGRISASCGKEKKYFNLWIIKSIIFTLILYLTLFALFLYLPEKPLANMGKPRPPLTWERLIDVSNFALPLSLFFGFFVFLILAETQKNFVFIQRKTQQSRNTKSYRKNKKLEIEDNKNIMENYHSLVYQEKCCGKNISVKIKFFPIQRIAMIISNCFIFTFLPVIIALFIRPFVMIAKGENIFQFFDGIFIGGGFVWYVAFCPFFCLYYLIKAFSRFTYEKPFIYQIISNGSQKKMNEFSVNILTEIFPILRAENVQKDLPIVILTIFIMFGVLALSVWVVLWTAYI